MAFLNHHVVNIKNFTPASALTNDTIAYLDKVKISDFQTRFHDE